MIDLIIANCQPLPRKSQGNMLSEILHQDKGKKYLALPFIHQILNACSPTNGLLFSSGKTAHAVRHFVENNLNQ